MAAGPPEPLRTVGQLIARLQQFDPDQEVVTANAGDSDHFQWILEVAPIPPAPALVGIIYMPPE